MRTYNFNLCHITAQTSPLHGFTKVMKFIAHMKKTLCETVYMPIIHNLQYVLVVTWNELPDMFKLIYE